MLVNGNDYSTIPLAIHVGNVTYDCSVDYILRGATEKKMNIVRSIQCQFKPDPLLKELFNVLEKYSKNKTIEQDIKIVKSDNVVRYIFPLVTKVESNFPYQWNPVKYKEVVVERKPASIVLMIASVLLSVVAVSLYIAKNQRKREQQKASE